MEWIRGTSGLFYVGSGELALGIGFWNLLGRLCMIGSGEPLPESCEEPGTSTQTGFDRKLLAQIQWKHSGGNCSGMARALGSWFSGFGSGTTRDGTREPILGILF